MGYTVKIFEKEFDNKESDNKVVDFFFNAYWKLVEAKIDHPLFKNIIKSIDWEYNNFVMGRDQEVTDFMYDNGLKSSVSGDIIVSPDKVIERYEREKKINKILKENKRIKNKPYDDYYVRKRFNEYHEKRMKNKREDL